MNLNLFSKEMRYNAFSLILWMVIISFLVAFTMSVFPTFLENQSKVMGMMSLVPKGALQFKGISDVADLTSALGFYAINNVIYMMVLGSVFSIVLSCNILLKEEYGKTAEYLLTRPLTRNSIFFTKLAVVILCIFLLNLVTALAGFISLKIVQKEAFPVSAFLILSGYTFLLNMLFAALGLFMSTLVKRPKPITTFGIALVLVFYFLFTISKITENASQIGYLSPFKYVRTDVLNKSYGLNSWHLIYFAGLSLVLLTLSYRLYRRKDIYT
jgi:ABC-2 type transport system permease protein